MMDGALNMSVTQVFSKGGDKYAFVSFEDETRRAEGKIPDCSIMSSNGFSREEITQLEDYMKKELPNLKKMASKINVLDAFMKG